MSSSHLPQFDSNHLAMDRTWLAHERTLMAWVRTATSMISFGFTIYKFFQFEAGKETSRRGLLTPRDFAMLMIGIGVISLVLSAISHRREVRELSAQLGGRRSMAEILAGLVSVFGILVMLSAIFHQ